MRAKGYAICMAARPGAVGRPFRCRWPRPERRHGSTRVLGHTFHAWRNSWHAWTQLVVYKQAYTRGNSWKICENSWKILQCVHLLFNSSWEFHQLAAGQLLSGQPVRYVKGRCGTARPSRTKSHLPGHSPPTAVSGQPSSLRPHWVCLLSAEVRGTGIEEGRK
jgi:hypothetical protein